MHLCIEFGHCRPMWTFHSPLKLFFLTSPTTYVCYFWRLVWFGLGEGRRLSDRVSVRGPGCSGTLRPGQPGRPRWPLAHPPPPPPSAGTKGMCHHHTRLLRVIMNAFVNSLDWTLLPFSCTSCCAFAPPQSAYAATDSQASTDHPGIDFFFSFFSATG